MRGLGGLADAAGTVIEPVLPYDGEFFVLQYSSLELL